jgi:spermidine/putrescine transport system substrate-binding protein
MRPTFVAMDDSPLTRRRFLRTSAAAAAAAWTLPARAHITRKPTLNVYCWTEYMPRVIVDDFARKFNVKVVVDTYPSNDEMLAGLKTANGKFDLIQPSEFVTEGMVKEGKLAELNLAALPNLKNIDPKYLHRRHDPEQRFSIPWLTGSVGIVVNTEKIKEPVRSYAEFFQEKYKGRLLVLADPRNMLTWPFAALGIPINDLTEANLARAKAVLARWLPLVGEYESDNPKTALLNGDADLGLVWSGEAAKLIEIARAFKGRKKMSFSFTVPKEGTHEFLDNLAIPKGAKDKALAEEFMNYVLTPEVGVQLWEEFPYTPVNAAARKLLTPEQLANPASFPPDNVKLTNFHAIPEEMLATLEKLVREVRLASA